MPKVRITGPQQRHLRDGREDVEAYARRLKREQQRRHEYTYSGGVTRCSKCPPQRTRQEPHRFCVDCARINNARQQAGLIRPAGDPRPSTDNIINPAVAGKYRGPSIQRRYSTAPQPVVSAFVEKVSRGWRRGVATLNGKRIYVGPKVQSVHDAWEFATNSQKLIKLGLQFESDCADAADAGLL